MQQARKSTRASVPLQPRYRNASSFQYVDGRCIDLSEGGMFIAADLPADQGTLIKFECAVDGQPGALSGVGRVVWRRSGGGPDRPSGMGLKFVKLEPGAAETIAQLVSEAQARGTTAPEAPLETQLRRTDSVPAEELAAAVGASGLHALSAPTSAQAPASTAAAQQGAPPSAAQASGVALVVSPSGSEAAGASQALAEPIAARALEGSATASAAAQARAEAEPAVLASPQALVPAHAERSSSGVAVWVALGAGAALLLWLLLR